MITSGEEEKKKKRNAVKMFDTKRTTECLTGEFSSESQTNRKVSFTLKRYYITRGESSMAGWQVGVGGVL